MKKYLLFAFALLIVAFCFLPIFESETGANAVETASGLRYAFAGEGGVPVCAEGAVLIDAKSLQVLFASNAEKRLGMASTTKIMTALLAIENGNLRREVVIPAAATGIEGSSIYLTEGERFTLEELLYGLMLESGNDAAEAIALAVSGSIPDFVALMNEKAGILGLDNTHFDNPHGLSSDNHYTSAADLAYLTAYALQSPIFAKIVSTESFYLTGEGKVSDRFFVNHNKLLKSYEGMIGVKTGYTKKTGRCLVTAAKRDDMLLVAVTLNSSDDWNDHRKMLDYGFSAFSMILLAKKGEYALTVPVVGGKDELVAISNPSNVYVCLPTDATTEERLAVPQFVYAPITEGQYIGSVRLYSGGELLEEIALCADRTVERKKLSLIEKLFG